MDRVTARAARHNASAQNANRRAPRDARFADEFRFATRFRFADDLEVRDRDKRL